MTQNEIKKELSNIYKEMQKWPIVNEKLNYSIPKDEIERREEFLQLRQILYNIEDARRDRDKNKEYFNLMIYYQTKVATV